MDADYCGLEKRTEETPLLKFFQSSIDCEKRGMTAIVNGVEFAKHDVMTFAVVIYI